MKTLTFLIVCLVLSTFTVKAHASVISQDRRDLNKCHEMLEMRSNEGFSLVALLCINPGYKIVKTNDGE